MRFHHLACWLWAVSCASGGLPAWAQTATPPAAPPPPVAAPAVPKAPCLFAPADLEPILARLPAPGVEQRDARGNSCSYAMPTRDVRRVVVQIDERFTAERFEQRVKIAARVAGSSPKMFEGIGDGAFYVAGVAGARRGLKYVEISGLRQSAARPITPADAATLLKLALERLPRF